MPRLGSGEIQFQGCWLNPAIAICICSHKPPHVPDRDRILGYVVRSGIDLNSDFSLVLDADNREDVLLIFGNRQTFQTFQTRVSTLAELAPAPDSQESGVEVDG